ncbi:MAG: nicotinate-nucleotide adenylyltransferase [Verrucomicrobia bacterium]|nr:nicotinate-nucleotide adenylyltransferase [Verrucomicrobiota bacterium]
MRIGILGGTFDPVHIGHLIIAETVRDELGLDKVLFVPAATPPHKQGRAIAPAADRLEMVRLATAGNPGFQVSDVEIRRGGVSYTVETIEALRASEGDAAGLFLIVGADSVRELATWKDIDHLVHLCTFVVVARPGVRIEDLVCEGIGLAPDTRQRVLRHYIDAVRVDISSTGLRARFAEGKTVRYRLPEAVERYIRTKGLYGTKENAPAAER